MITELSLEQFRNKITDIARSNRFEVEIVPPDEFRVYTKEQYDVLSWTVESAQIPKRDVGEIVIKYHGMELKLPGDYGKENLTIGFLNTYEWYGRTFFENWMEYIQKINKESGFQNNSDMPNSRASAFAAIDTALLKVKSLGRVGEVLSQYTFYNVFPTSISSIDLSMSNEEVQKFTVTFAYSHFF